MSLKYDPPSEPLHISAQRLEGDDDRVGEEREAEAGPHHLYGFGFEIRVRSFGFRVWGLGFWVFG